MIRIFAPEFRGNIGGRFVLPSPRAGTFNLTVLLAVIAVVCLSPAPSYALTTNGLSFSRVVSVNCARMFTLPDIEGHARALGGEKGKPVIVHFFATWCEPCKAEFGTLQQFYKARGDKLGVIAISVGEVPGRVRSFLKETPVDFPVLLDADRSVTKAWAVEGLPTTIVLDKTLRPVLSVSGDLDWTRAGVNDEIEDALANSPDSKIADCSREDIP